MRNPGLTICWYLVAILATVFCAVPVVTAGSLVAAFALACLAEGPRRALAPLRWQLPLLALIVLVNPLFANVGQTVLLRVWIFTYTAESLLYGLEMGCMLLATLLWFEALFRAVTQDQIADIVSALSPAVGLMLGLVMRFTGRSVERIARQSRLDAANTALGAHDRKNVLGEGLDTLTMLLGFTLERALVQGEYMQALGWGLKPRTRYRSWALTRAEKIALVAYLVLVLVAVPALALASRFFAFYPAVSFPSAVSLLGVWTVPGWTLYLPCLALFAVPVAARIREEYAWAHR